jgi:hypothetical protein
MIRFRPEVRLGFIDKRLTRVLQAAAVWSFRTGVDVAVNSIEDGAPVHMQGSLHGFGLAIDLETARDVASETQQLGEFLAKWLDRDYDVVLEADHVHVEWDTHRTPVLPWPTRSPRPPGETT